MAFRLLLQRGTILPAAATAFAASTLLIPSQVLYAEAVSEDIQPTLSRKPIYDVSPSKTQPQPPSSPENSPSSPTTTDRLAAHIRTARIFLQVHTALVEDKVNNGLTSFFDLENSFTSTIASLAPNPATGEKLLPGGIYVLVASMAGSILTRNRNILLRATGPVALGIGAGWVVLPHTMRNVADLVWRYEEKVPVLAANHMRVRGAVVQGGRELSQRSEALGVWAQERAKASREVVEGWVRKGR